MVEHTAGGRVVARSNRVTPTMDTNPTYERLLGASIRFVSYRPRSEKEIRNFLQKKLTRWKIFGGTVVQKVADRLAELGYLDDAKFAAWWVEQRQTFKPKGMRLITQELKAKGVDLRQFSSDRGKIDMIDEIEAAKRAVQKKLTLWEKLPTLDRKKKLSDFLSRRGFTYDTVERVIDSVAKKE
ncbi:MAG: Regulatory protein RecX [Candidatus Gottesmanbacteria bacterium GW2011_GWA1_48_13]|uniref:Regulatory protein RecX n=2 Tax=Candidatus Gottesmaniibacteriota TaxID=1752720 RepID=A0A0G1UNU5_9BACT|nr:MAG: Regulatory protein RecX [Candidatus Gottesmanbacteria bacterium GW2011_GWA1_48_13]